MIALIVTENVFRYLEDYMTHFRVYLKKYFSLNVKIYTYRDTGSLKIPDEFSHIIFIQTICSRIAYNNMSKKMFLLNTEQLTFPRHITLIKDQMKKIDIPIIDYSAENISILEKIYPARTFIHFPFPVMFDISNSKNIDMVSLKNSDYRKTVCRDIGMDITDFNGMWKDDRDELIKSAKMLVNIHYMKEYCIFESIRCYHALEFGTLIISEPSVNMDTILLGDFVIFPRSDESIKDTIYRVMTNYSKYYNECFSPERIKIAEDRLLETYTQGLDKMFNVN